jgi:membrane protein YdbS with pleckstrin-like domain
MRFEPRERLDPEAVTVWRISSAITSAIVCLCAVGLFFIAANTNLPLWVAALVGCVAVIFTYFFVEPLPKLLLYHWRYEVSEHEIDIKHGILVVKRTLIPMVRVQHVDTKQGPILRRYGLATVTISTAARVHEIPALSLRDADALRDRIAELARVVDEDV